jgi:hypothetical protein
VPKTTKGLCLAKDRKHLGVEKTSKEISINKRIVGAAVYGIDIGLALPHL